MNIIVPMKRVADTETKVGVSGSQIDESTLKSWVINPTDEYALEEALRLVEREGGKITLLCIGPAEVQETIRKGLAMGADEAYHLQDAAFNGLDPLGEARLLAAAIEKIGEYDLIWTGWKSWDDDLGQTGVLLAEMLDLPHVQAIMTVTEAEKGAVVVRAEGEGGIQMIRVSTPAVLTESQGPNEPRYPSLKGIMGAKKKPLTVWSASDLGVDPDELATVIEIISVERPPSRAAGRVLQGDPAEAVHELVRLLRQEAKAL